MDIQKIAKIFSLKHRFLKNLIFFLIGLLFVISKTPFVFAAIQFPEPEGPYSVGYRVREFTDSSREDPYNTGLPRRVKVAVYYPSKDERKTEPYGDEEILFWKTGLNELLGKGAITPEDFAKAAFEFNCTEVFKSKDATPAPEPFPVILFEHGLDVNPGAYQRMLLELVSHGYVVIASSHPGIASTVIFEDGTEEFIKAGRDARMVDTAFLDTLFILKQIDAIASTIPSMDLAKLGMMGHSFGGGTTTVKMVRHEQRILAGIALEAPTSHIIRTYSEDDTPTDGTPTEITLDPGMELDPGDNLEKPFMHMFSDNPMCDPSIVGLEDKTFKVTIRQGTKKNFVTDYPLVREGISILAETDLDTGPSEASSYQGEMSQVIKSFFDKFLKGEDVNLMQLSSDVITVETETD